MKRYIRQSKNMSVEQYIDLFEDVDEVRKFIDAHEDAEDGIDLDEYTMLFVRKDDDNSDYDHIDIGRYYDDYVDHIVFYANGDVDKFRNV